MQIAALPFLDTADPDFSTRGRDVRQARDTAWAARTPYGLAVLRWQECGTILRDRRFRQGSHNWPETMGLTGPFARFWRDCLIGQEGRTHRRLRSILTPALSNAYVVSMIPVYEEIAETLCAGLRQKNTAEFQSEFAVPFSGQAVTSLLGLPLSDWPEISRRASELGLAMGVEAKRHEPIFDAAYITLRDLGADLVARVRAGKDEDSFIARLVARFDKVGDTTQQELSDLIVIAIFGGVDTTRGQLGLGLSLFIADPTQWQALRDDETRVPSAVEEFIRARPTTTWVTREATEDVVINDLTIPEGTVIHLLVHATSRDPQICEVPDFDITRDRKTHFGFGGGTHHCVGHMMARTDMAAALRSLRKTFKRVWMDGQPVYLPDSGNTAPERLPIGYEVEV